MNIDESESAPAIKPPHELSIVVVPLLKGVLYQEENQAAWSALLNQQAGVRDYVDVLGLELVLDEAEGYAFLRSRQEEANDDSAVATPRLVARRQLSYPVSLLLALLRKKLAESDAGGGDTRLILSRDEVVELVRIFLPPGSNEVKLIDQVEQDRRAGVYPPSARAEADDRGAPHYQGLCRCPVAGRLRPAAVGLSATA